MKIKMTKYHERSLGHRISLQVFHFPWYIFMAGVALIIGLVASVPLRSFVFLRKSLIMAKAEYYQDLGYFESYAEQYQFVTKEFDKRGF